MKNYEAVDFLIFLRIKNSLLYDLRVPITLFLMLCEKKISYMYTPLNS